LNPGQRRGRPAEIEKRSNKTTELKAELFEQIKAKRSEFETWVMTTTLQKKQKRSYISAIGKITTLDALENALSGSKTQRLALRKFILFLRDEGYINDLVYEKYKRLIQLPRTGIDTRFYSDADIKKILNDVRAQKSEKYYLFLRLVVESGLRRSHAVLAYNKIVEGEGRQLGNVYEVILNVTKGTKKAFVCFCSTETARKIRKLDEKISESGVHKLSQQGILFNAIRKWWATTAFRSGMREDIIDFVQGRASRSVLSRHYINKLALAEEEYARVLQVIEEKIFN